MSIKYTVIVNDYAKRHFIKSFEKKYLNKWDITLRAIMLELESIEYLQATNFFEKIHIFHDYYIGKGEFKIAGTNESKKSSGCRYIVKVDIINFIAEILLIYHKSNVDMNNETIWWQKQIENL